MNWGTAQATGKWLLLVNNDTLFPAGALDALKRVIHDAPDDVAMLGPVTNSAGNGQRLWKPGATAQEWLETGAWIHQHPTGHLMPTSVAEVGARGVPLDASGLPPAVPQRKAIKVAVESSRGRAHERPQGHQAR